MLEVNLYIPRNLHIIPRQRDKNDDKTAHRFDTQNVNKW